MSDPENFEPTQAARDLYATVADERLKRGIDLFIQFWESEGETSDPRRAGSLVAAAYVMTAARVAVFATQCARETPRKEQWLKMCEEHFDRAVLDCTMAFAEAGEETDAGPTDL